MTWVYDISGLGEEQIAWLTEPTHYDLGDGSPIETGAVIAPGVVRLTDHALDLLREREEDAGGPGRGEVGSIGWSGHGPTIYLPCDGAVREWEMIERSVRS